MIISVPLNTPLNETPQTIVAGTDVEDATDIFVNTSSEDIPIDQEYQEYGKIYQNTTLAIIPVVPYTSTPTVPYEIGDLVFTSDGETPAVDRVQQITGTIGDFAKQPEDYSIIPTDTSYDDSTWDARYMEMDTFPLGASLHGINFTIPDLTDSKAFCFSYDGYYLFIVSDNGINNMRIRKYYLHTAYDVTDVGFLIQDEYLGLLVNGWIIDIDISRDGLNMAILGTDSLTNPSYTLARNFEFSSPNVMDFDINNSTAKVLNPAYPLTAINWNINGTYVSLSDDINIYQWAVSPNYDLSSMGTSRVSPTLPNGVFDFTFSDNGLKVWVSYQVDLNNAYIREYTMTSAHDVTTLTYASEVIALKGNTWYHSSVSPDGTKLFQLASDFTNDIIYQLELSTPNDITTNHYSVFPLEYTETRNSIIYKYKIEYLNSIWYMRTHRNSDYDEYYPLTYFDHVSDTSLEEKAYIGTNGVWLAKTLIVRPEGIYIRTNTDAEVETEPITDYRYQVIESVADIKGMSYIGYNDVYNPFDNTNYTLATKNGSMYYNLQATEKFDTIALGHVKADHILIEFIDINGTIVPIIDRDIDSSRDILGNLPDWNTTLIYYSDIVLDPLSSVRVTLTTVDPTKEIELGTLLLGISADAGFTNLTLTNQYKDYSVFNTDDFGNSEYIERAKVSKYSGTVDIEIENYDMTDRLMTSLGANLVIMNGSGAKNEPPNSLTIFSATQKIGRFTSFSQKTNISDNDIDVMATYSFTLEEIV